MATVAHPPSDLSTEDKKLASSRLPIKDFGDRVVETNNAFFRVGNTLDKFVGEYGGRFPGLVPFQREWNGYISVRCAPTFVFCEIKRLPRAGRLTLSPPRNLRRKLLFNMKVSLSPFLVLTGLDSCLESRLYNAAQPSRQGSNRRRYEEDGSTFERILRMSIASSIYISLVFSRRTLSPSTYPLVSETSLWA